MKILAINETTLPLSSSIRNAYIDFSKMNVSAVAVVTDVIREGKPVVGFGFGSPGRYAQGCLLRDRFIPRIMSAEPESLINDEGTNLEPTRIWARMMTNEKPGGHGERSVAVGVLDMAVWDAVAKIEGKPLYRLLADRYNGGRVDARVWVYAAGGYYHPTKDRGALQDEMRDYLSQGYSTVKIKIGGASLAEDIQRVESVLKVVGEGRRLAVDANGRFDLPAAIKYAKALAPYRLKWYEEPGDPLDFALHKELSRHYTDALATGENLFSIQDARNLIRYGGMRPETDFLQFDCVASYGLVEYLRTLAMIGENGWSVRRCVPHGGHLLSLHITAGLGLGGVEAYPGVFQPFGGFADGIPIEDGYVKLPDVPGIGIEAKQNLYEVIEPLARI